MCSYEELTQTWSASVPSLSHLRRYSRAVRGGVQCVLILSTQLAPQAV